MWFKRRLVKKKLKALEALRKADPANQRAWQMLEALCFELPEGLFKDYQVKEKYRLELVSIHGNVESLLRVLEDSCHRIIQEMPASKEALYGDDNAKVVTLGEWLETTDGYPTKPRVAWDLLQDNSVRLLKHIEECQRPEYTTVYRRKHTYVFLDTIVAMEALLHAAL